MSTIDRDLLQLMLTKVLTMVQKLLLKCTSENAHKSYDILLPWKEAAWPDVWNGFVDGVIIPYLMCGHGNVHNKPPPRGMATTDTWVDHLMRWASKISPQKMLDLLQGEFPRKYWQGALCRFFTVDCDDKMVL